MNKQQAHAHHYVPEWYQRRFLRTEQFKYHYLDLHPETITNNGVKYQRRDLLHWGPARCFYQDDLYTLKLGGWSTDNIERRFFGEIDSRGRHAVGVFSEYTGYCPDLHKAFPALPQYMDAQRFRTPRGLDQLKAMTDSRDRNQLLVVMQQAYRFHTTMWTEGVWEVVRASESPTKFIVSDEPVTFHNRTAFPSELTYPHDVGLEQLGTRTIFPLSLESCLIITHTQFARNPWAKPSEPRINARAYQNTMKYMLDTQFGRELAEDEVLRINYILKRRATRYIAAAEENWLYPEKYLAAKEWAKLDDDWFLLPNLYKVSFTSGIYVGWADGSTMAMDEYGQHPGDPNYKDEKRRDKEWNSHQKAKREWAKKRRGKSVAHVDEFRSDKLYDKIMLADLSKTDEGQAVASQ
jgi:Protein of unknown function (DUF4238)